MDIVLARTFLAVVASGSFVEAAKRVHCSQSTVSLRMKTLEEQLGALVFLRGKEGVALTAAGERFLRHAQTLVRVWQQAKLDAALPEGVRATLAIGGQASLWDRYLVDCVALMRARAPDVAIRSELGFADSLNTRLIDGALDIAVMYAPRLGAGFEVERLFDDVFVLVSSDASPEMRDGGLPPANYVFVDWGEAFRAEHANHYPDVTIPTVQLGIGSLGLKYLFATSACGYFPARLVDEHLETGSLTRVAKAATFSCPAFAVYSAEPGSDAVDTALRCMRDAAEAFSATS